MDGQTSGTTEAAETPIEINSWEAAFAALEPKAEESDPAVAGAGADDGDNSDGDTGSDSGQGLSDQDETVDSGSSEVHTGGLDPNAGRPGQEDGGAFAGMFGIDDDAIAKFEQTLNDDIQKKAMDDIAREFLNRNVRSSDGQLGATIKDADILKRDEDGVAHYYNPETGREYTGDNPRAQAQEWVDLYNRDLANAFTKAVEQYEQHLKSEAAPRLAVMKFAPKYEKLDEIRRGMFDNVIEDYEIKDSDGKTIGYSCDLEKALALVERQVVMIQDYAKKNAQSSSGDNSKQSGGPVLDMKATGGVRDNDDIDVKSLADAMERIQDAQLEKFKNR